MEDLTTVTPVIERVVPSSPEQCEYYSPKPPIVGVHVEYVEHAPDPISIGAVKNMSARLRSLKGSAGSSA